MIASLVLALSLAAAGLLWLGESTLGRLGNGSPASARSVARAAGVNWGLLLSGDTLSPRTERTAEGDPRAGLCDPDPQHRRAAVLTVAHTGDPAVVGAVLNLLTDPDGEVRSAAAEALGLLNDTRGVEPLLALLPDPHPAVRRSATLALGRLRVPRAIGFLVEMLADSDPLVPPAAVVALEEITGQGLGPDPAAWREWWRTAAPPRRP